MLVNANLSLLEESLFQHGQRGRSVCVCGGGNRPGKGSALSCSTQSSLLHVQEAGTWCSLAQSDGLLHSPVSPEWGWAESPAALVKGTGMGGRDKGNVRAAASQLIRSRRAWPPCLSSLGMVQSKGYLRQEDMKGKELYAPAV